MSETRITDLVAPEAIEKIKELSGEMQNLLVIYTSVAKDLAKGVDVNIRVVGDIDRLETFLVEKSKQAADVNRRLNDVITEQKQVISDTTNTISRQLMEQERLNKSHRDSYAENEKAKRGLSIIEVLSTCPTNWGLSPAESMQFVKDKMIPYYPLGVYKDVTAEEAAK